QVNLVDDPSAGYQVGLRFDPEGTPKHPLTLVRAGVTEAVPHDRRTAKAAGAVSTGHAIPGGTTWGALPMNLNLLPAPAEDGRVTEVAGPAADSAVLALVGQVERGLLVTDHWSTRVLDPRTLVMTGLTR